MKPKTFDEGYSPFATAKPGTSENQPEEKPEVIDGRIQLPLFGNAFPASRFCKLLYEHMSKSDEAYLRSGVVCGLVSGKLVPVTSAMAVTWLDRFVDCLRCDEDKASVRTGLQERHTRVILAATERSALPPIETVVAVPVMCDRDSKIIYAEEGYCRELALYVTGTAKLEIEALSLDDAVAMINSTFKDYQFQHFCDRSRAIAALLTPGFKQGGFIKSHVPMTLVEANETQSGKTKLARCNAAVYGEQLQMVARKVGGVGSLDESISTALIEGRPHICVDNYRGRLDSPFLETI